MYVSYDFVISLECGGIYLDPDVLSLRPIDKLMEKEVSLGRESHDGLANGIILAKPNAPFIRLWLNAYRYPIERFLKQRRRYNFVPKTQLDPAIKHVGLT